MSPIKDLMTTGLISVDRDDTVRDAAALMMKHQLSVLAVVDCGRRLLGLIAKSDLFEEIWDPLVCDTPVVRYMTMAGATLSPDDDVARAVELLAAPAAPLALPVVCEGRVVGMMGREILQSAAGPQRRRPHQPVPGAIVPPIEPHFLHALVVLRSTS